MAAGLLVRRQGTVDPHTGRHALHGAHIKTGLIVDPDQIRVAVASPVEPRFDRLPAGNAAVLHLPSKPLHPVPAQNGVILQPVSMALPPPARLPAFLP